MAPAVGPAWSPPADGPANMDALTHTQTLRRLLEQHSAAFLELQNDFCDQADVELLGLFKRADTHAFDQHRQKVSGSGGNPAERLTWDGRGGHANDVPIGQVVQRGYAGARDVLIINAQCLLQQAHRAGRRLAGAHLGPLLGSDLHRPFEQPLVVRHC